MIGTFRWNIGFGAFGFLLTLLFSFSNNVISTTLLRSFYTFWILFFAMFAFRWLLGSLVGLKQIAVQADQESPDTEASDHLGTNVNLETPADDASLQQMLKGQDASGESAFVPLQPPKLLLKNDLDPEQLAGALRRMSEDG